MRAGLSRVAVSFGLAQQPVGAVPAAGDQGLWGCDGLLVSVVDIGGTPLMSVGSLRSTTEDVASMVLARR